MKYFLIILLCLNIATVFAKEKCSEVYAERFDVNQEDNFDLDIKDQYQIGEKKKLNNLRVYKFLEKYQNKFKYSSEFALNLSVKKHMKEKIKSKSLFYYKLKDLENQTRQAVLFKDSLDAHHYISFIVYTNLECNLNEKN